MKSVSVLGLGYVGLPTAIQLANSGYEVSGFDIDFSKVKNLRDGSHYFEETDIKAAYTDAILSGKLRIVDKLEPADVFVIAVPTPAKEDKSADLTFIFDAVRNISRELKPGNLVIIESTSPVGTTEKVSQLITRIRLDLIDSLNQPKFFLAYCPERVLPGNTLAELISNPRVVGGMNQESGKQAQLFYSQFSCGTISIVDHKTAEMVKLVENSFRDVNIAFANEIASIAEENEIDVRRLIAVANMHPRVKILSPGPGVGGHCIAVDPWFLLESASGNFSVVRAARMLNDNRPNEIVQRVVEKLKSSMKEKSKIRILVFGLSYKRDSGDLRESPAIQIIKKLSDLGYKLDVCEPWLSSNHFNIYKNLSIDDVTTKLGEYDLGLILTDHSAFSPLLPFLRNMRIHDTRGFLREEF